MESGSQIFLPYKSIGYVSSGVPFQLRAEKLHYSIMLAVGNSFQLLNSIKLFPRMISNSQEGKIRDMKFFKKDHFLTTCKKDIILWKGQSEEFRFKGHSSTVEMLMVFDNILFSKSKNNELIMWDAVSRLMFTEQLPEFNAATHKITQLYHPLGYFNKILIGFESGEIQLWNIKTKTMIYQFKNTGKITDTSRSSTPGDQSDRLAITTFEQSPIADIVAIGRKDGTVLIHNLKLDKSILTYQQQGAITSISFRTDGQKQHVASSSSTGQVLVWDLESNKPFHTLVNAHHGHCTKVEFLREEPIIITTGTDNSVKMWQFNGVDGVPIILRERTGHLDPPKSVEFFGGDSQEENTIISISNQSIRFASIVASTINQEMSKKKLQKDIGPFLEFSSNFRKNRSWETAISIHSDSKQAYTWDCTDMTVKKQLNIKAPITSVKISTCGNFVFFGTAFGAIYKYNIQSGIKRGKIVDSTISGASVSSILVEPTNQYLITSNLGSNIHYWDFNSLKHLHTITLVNGGKKRITITKMVLHSDSGIFAVVADDGMLRCYDIDTRNLVRQFTINGTINDVVFSNDGRWLVVSTETDMIVRVLDIPSGKMIDWFKMPKPVTSLAFSPKGEYLITTHAGKLPIYLWSNQAHFGSVFLKVPTQKPNTIILPSQVIEITATGNGNGGDKKSKKSKQQNKEDAENQEEFESQEDLGVPETEEKSNDIEMGSNDQSTSYRKANVKQISGLITTSTDVAKSKWQSLLNLDIIKERNRPIQQKEKPALAPFFLSTIEGLEPKFAKVDVVNPLTSKVVVAAAAAPTTTDKKQQQDGEDDEDEEREPTEEELKGWDNWASAADDEDEDIEGKEEESGDEEMKDEEGDEEDSDKEDSEDEEIKSKSYKSEKDIYRSDKIIKTDSLQGTRTKFNLSLEQGYKTQNYSNSLNILKSLTPSGIDFEIRTLTTSDDYADVHYMFDFIVYQLMKNCDYDFIQSILSVSLKVHGYLLYTTPFKKDLRQLLIVFNEPWIKMQKLYHSNICMLRYFTNTLNN